MTLQAKLSNSRLEYSELPYTSHWEFLQAELRLLDDRLAREVERFQQQYGDSQNTWRGLVITHEEVEHLLGSRPDSTPSEEALDKVDMEAIHQKRIKTSLEANIFLPLMHLSRMFHLSRFEEQVIVMAIAPWLDARYERIYAYLQDHISAVTPTVSLMLRVLCDTPARRMAERSALSPARPLLKHGLLKTSRPESADEAGLAEAIIPDERILNYLLGENECHVAVERHGKLYFPGQDTKSHSTDAELVERLVSIARNHLQQNGDPRRLIFALQGPRAAGKEEAIVDVCGKLGATLLVLDAESVTRENNPEKILRMAIREAVLLPCALYLKRFDALCSDEAQYSKWMRELLRLIQEYAWLTFLDCESHFPPDEATLRFRLYPVEFQMPNLEARRQIWKRALNGTMASEGIDVNALAVLFCLSAVQIEQAVETALNLAHLRAPDANGTPLTQADLYEACRRRSNNQLANLATKVEIIHSWEDLILSDEAIQQLREIIAWMRHRYRVSTTWGFGKKIHRRNGLAVLFAGASGTGKTLAAEIIAREVGLDLYKIDLSAVVSKYIGETEKNLRRVFEAAETSNAILFFDEADALFGKRSEVKDAHDRYANVEIAYLLQRMEEYSGMSILATNLKKNIDEAFLRRLQFLVDFPFPDEGARLRIWQHHFPLEAPVDADVDLPFLARQFQVAGGNIKNIVLNAAYLAAEEDTAIAMRHLIRATKSEYEKMGKVCLESEFGKYYPQIKPKIGNKA